MRSLRGRLSLGVGLVIAVVLGLSGLFISNDAESIARDGLDEQLERTAQLSEATAKNAVAKEVPGKNKRLDAILGGSGTSLRLQVGKIRIPLAGAELIDGPIAQPGFRTVERDGRRFRVLVTRVEDTGFENSRLEVSASLAGIERRASALDRRLLRLGLGALFLAALGTFVAAFGVLAPLRRLRVATGRIADQEDLATRVPETDGPAEVRQLAASFNGMLGRLDTASEARERALFATRRFALDAGHELRTPLTTVQATLSALHRHPEVAAEQRTSMLGDALDEQRRLVTLLDGLQAYARGDASTVAHEPVDLADVVEAAAGEVRAEYPGVTIETDIADTTVTGWEAGLRLIARNLIGNAARHGPDDGTVRVRLADRRLTVDDQGTGVPAADRERIFEPFTRLDAAGAREGSGLGLALVAQQVREHGAEVRVEDAPGGGARFVVTFAQ